MMVLRTRVHGVFLARARCGWFPHPFDGVCMFFDMLDKNGLGPIQEQRHGQGVDQLVRILWHGSPLIMLKPLKFEKKKPALRSRKSVMRGGEVLEAVGRVEPLDIHRLLFPLTSMLRPPLANQP